MRAPSSRLIAVILFAIATLLLALIATHKPKVATSTVTTHSDDTVAKYIEEVEKQNTLERDRKEQADKLAKLTKAKRESVECQFWTQQKQKKSSDPRLNDKITQFCELPLEQNAPSLASTKKN